jgi:myosin heavy subunit
MKTLALTWQQLNIEIKTIYAKLLARGKTIDKLERKLKKLRRKSASQHQYLGKYSKFEDENSELKTKNIKLEDACSELVRRLNELTNKNEGLVAENEELRRSNANLAEINFKFERFESKTASKKRWLPDHYQWSLFNSKLDFFLKNIVETTFSVVCILIALAILGFSLGCFGYGVYFCLGYLGLR